MNQAKENRRYRSLLGATVLAVLVLFLLTLIKAEALRELFDPGKTLRLVLPDEGLFGLAEGAKIEVLGTPAGKVLKIVIDPDQKIHALARLNGSMAPFVRRDSQAVIRKTFGVAGESYVEITRGRGEAMDWDYAVLQAAPDRAQTESIGEILADVRSRVIPILEQTERTMTALGEITAGFANPEGDLQKTLADVRTMTGRIERGKGAVGRLLSDERTASELEQLIKGANAAVARLGPVLDELHATAAQAKQLSTSINAQSKDLPEITAHVKSVLTSLDAVMLDLRKTSPQLPAISRDIEETTANIPVLLGMTQQTLAELEALLRQLRSNWLLGGGGAPPQTGGRLPPTEVRP
ncbi:MAG: virulence factor Mce family protein [Candidatus Accumulibacter appositus]|uniref:Virulence factor Mce family protein n=1 Tax=Candidatus Accumulibacter appositus TaxID=1454003 RepID=A0A011NGR7_9PROT|nr:MAG: virulence factor Mce family protein [Candidatus Accumulibacter appositus]